MGWLIRGATLSVGMVLALVPAAAAAQASTSRSLAQPHDFWKAFVLTALGLALLLLLATLGRLYQRQRGLHWPFQDPDPSTEEHHG